MGIFGSYYEMFDEARNKLDNLSKPNKTPLNELTIGGEKIEEDEDEFSIDNEEETAAEEPDTPETEAAPEPAVEEGDSVEPAEATDAADTPENANDVTTTDDDVEDDFSLPEDAENDDTATEGEEPATDNMDGENEEDIDDNFSMGDEGGDGDAETADENAGQEEGEDSAEGGESVSGSTEGNEDELKQDEDKLYDTLTDDQKKIRTLQLKISFKDIYEQCDSVLNSINEIPKSDENIEIIRRLIVVINNVKKYITDYIAYEFDKNTYLDNNQIYIKYINVFRTIKKTIDELAKPQKD